MYTMPLLTDIGAYLDPRQALVPAARSAGAVTPPIAIDRMPQGLGGAQSAVLVVTTGAATGTPDTVSVTCKIQTRADSSDSYADYKPDGETTASVAVTSASGLAYLSVNLTGAEKEIGVHTTVAFTGGTSPTILCSAQLILADLVVPTQ